MADHNRFRVPMTALAPVQRPAIDRNQSPKTGIGTVKPGIIPGSVNQDQTYSTDIYTLFTKIGGSNLLYTAQSWVRVILRLETAGPVSVSTRESIPPVLSGRGVLLDDNDLEFALAKGNRLYYSAEAVNRVRFVVEPIPWGESILRSSRLGFDRIVKSLSPLSRIGKR